MNAFSDIDSLLRVISREKDILRFLFVSRKAPSLRPEQALENFLEEDSRRLEYLLDSDVYGRVMIFTNTKFMAHRVCATLQKNGFDADELHGDIAQNKRSEIMARFKKGKLAILVCTDVAARGIDVDDVEAVINYDLPNENEYYLHRIGRTGRAHRHGVAFTLETFAESVRMDEILKYMKTAPTMLHFDEMGILRDEDEQAFFENI